MIATPSTLTKRVIVDEEINFEVPVFDIESSEPDAMSNSDAEVNGGSTFPVVKADPPATYDQIARLLDAKMSKMVTVDHLQGVITKMDDNTHKISCLSSDLSEIRDEMANDRRQNNERFNLLEQNPNRPALGNDSSKEAVFLRARRTIRAWPIEGGSEEAIIENFKQFALGALRIDPVSLGEIHFSARRVRNSPESVAHHEVAVTCVNPADRDYITSKARNLAEYIDRENLPTAGIKMDIPQYLMGTFKL